jgi:hypothetical protein
MTLSTRGWLRLSIPQEWDRIGDGIWTTRHRGHVSAADVLDSRTEITPESAVEAHESWCEAHHVNAQQIRMEQLPNGLCVLRSFGETRSDEFLMVAHIWTRNRLSLLVFRAPLEHLSDDDLADVLNAILEAKPLEGNQT